KTTVLRMIAGLESVTDGTVQVGEQVVNQLPPRDRDVAMVFQNYALYPHMTVFGNMAFPLEIQHVDKREIAQRVREAAEVLDREDGTLVASFGSTRLAIDESVLESRPALARFEGRRVILGIRPEDFEDAEFRSDAPDDRRMEIEVDLREALGSEILLHFRVDAPIVLTDDTRELAVDVGTDSLERLEQRAQAGSSSFVARVSPRSSARRHDRVQLAVDTSRAHFFEPETGRGIRLD